MSGSAGRAAASVISRRAIEGHRGAGADQGCAAGRRSRGNVPRNCVKRFRGDARTHGCGTGAGATGRSARLASAGGWRDSAGRAAAGRPAGSGSAPPWPPPARWPVTTTFRPMAPPASSTSQIDHCLSFAGSQPVPSFENLCSCGGNQNRRTTDLLTWPTRSPPVSPPSASGSPVSFRRAQRAGGRARRLRSGRPL
jgi:hypothetical protein